CGRLLTIGVMHRVEEMADREDGVMPPQAIPYKHLIPLEEIISQALGVGRDSQQVKREYTQMIEKWGGELNILLHLEEEVIKENFPSSIGEAILNMRKGEVEIEPGYDGVYGEVRIKVSQEKKNQLSLF
ncbi:DNA helicase UvrD, partial [Candidatus Calescamantes bacterium]|nr:DNA helicase UvrD [Candidatus Calescamantes bacterium]